MRISSFEHFLLVVWWSNSMRRFSWRSVFSVYCLPLSPESSRELGTSKQKEISSQTPLKTQTETNEGETESAVSGMQRLWQGTNLKLHVLLRLGLRFTWEWAANHFSGSMVKIRDDSAFLRQDWTKLAILLDHYNWCKDVGFGHVFVWFRCNSWFIPLSSLFLCWTELRWALCFL